MLGDYPMKPVFPVPDASGDVSRDEELCTEAAVLAGLIEGFQALSLSELCTVGLLLREMRAENEPQLYLNNKYTRIVTGRSRMQPPAENAGTKPLVATLLAAQFLELIRDSGASHVEASSALKAAQALLPSLELPISCRSRDERNAGALLDS